MLATDGKDIAQPAESHFDKNGGDALFPLAAHLFRLTGLGIAND